MSLYNRILKRERDGWRDDYEAGGDEPYLLTAYKEHREDDLWRYSRQVEQVLEYTLYLESLLGVK